MTFNLFDLLRDPLRGRLRAKPFEADVDEYATTFAESDGAGFDHLAGEGLEAER